MLGLLAAGKSTGAADMTVREIVEAIFRGTAWPVREISISASCLAAAVAFQFGGAIHKACMDC